MMLSAAKVLKLPHEISELAIPLAVSAFRINPAISSTFKLLFLAHVYDLELETGQLLSFLAFGFVVSFGTGILLASVTPRAGLSDEGTSGATIRRYLATEARHNWYMRATWLIVWFCLLLAILAIL